MTQREAYISIWRQCGLNQKQIDQALRDHALRNPGTLAKPAPFPPGKEAECISRLVAEVLMVKAMLPTHYGLIKAIIEGAERQQNAEN